LLRAGANHESESLLLDLISSEETSPQTNPLRVVNFRQGLANTLIQQGRYEEALAIIRKVIPVEKQIRGEGHPETLMSRQKECWALAGLGNLGEAEELQKAVLTDTLRTQGPENSLTWIQQEALANILLLRGKHNEAEELAFDAMTESELGRGTEDAFTVRVTSTWACARAAGGKFGEPSPETVMVYVVEWWMKQSKGKGNDIMEEMVRIATVCHQGGNMDKSRKWAQRALDNCEQGFVPYPAKVSEYKKRLEKLFN
jgi:tetratricopeptide (TPR) repeat protein